MLHLPFSANCHNSFCKARGNFTSVKAHIQVCAADFSALTVNVKHLYAYWSIWAKSIPLKFFITNFLAAPGFVFTKGDVLLTPLGLLRAEKFALF